MGIIEKVYAATNVNGNTLSNAINPSVTGGSITDLVTKVISWIIYIAGVLAFIYLVYSGILFVTAAGNPEQAKKGQQGLINAVIGIIVIVLAYVILTAVSGQASTSTISETIQTIIGA